MKSFSKISSSIIVAAMATMFNPTASADEVVIKPLRVQPPAKSLFAEKIVVAPKAVCPMCKEELVATQTQDSKLKTKTVLAATHACKECKTTIVRTGAQKATGKDVAQHKCGALIAAVEACCGGMK
jgi:hypothetical protein